MKREFLEGLGLEKDTIDKIMTENGNDINREKAKADEYKSQLDAAKQTLKGFEGVDVAKLQGEITKLNTDLANKDADYQKKINALANELRKKEELGMHMGVTKRDCTEFQKWEFGMTG